MILGRITGKTTTKNFKFKIANNAQKFQYVQVMHKDCGYILGQIHEIEREKEEIARCGIIGYRKDGKIQMPRSPLHQGDEVLYAEDRFIRDVLGIEEKGAAYIGKLEGRDIRIYLELNKLLSRHLAIIAKTGAGKSYTCGILVEEILDRKVPLLIIDPHGEYSKIKYENDQELELLKKNNLKPKGYKEQIREYGDRNIDNSLEPVCLNEEFSVHELMHILPSKLTQAQKATVYSVIKDLSPVTLNNLAEALEAEQSITSVNLSSILDYMKSLDLFSPDFTPYEELVKPGMCSIINLKGIAPEVQEIIVYKLLRDLFEQRKLGNVAPFFCVIEEAHNFAPERSFGQAKSSGIIRTIASEGRKFGLGLCVLSQRPARLDKNVLSQCNTHIILKVTNPNDLRSLTNSVENVSSDMEGEIKNLPVGTALVSGVIEIPLLVKIRPRKSRHGGYAVNILETSSNSGSKFLPVIMPRTSEKDLRLIEGRETAPVLIPAVLVEVENKKRFNLLIEMVKGHIVRNIDTKETIALPELTLSKTQENALNAVLELEKFDLAKLNEKTKMPILKLKEYAGLFLKNNIINKEKGKFELSETGRLLKHPEKFGFTDRIKHMQINYKSKLKPRKSREEIRKGLGFLKVKNIRDCYMVYYKVG
ncbi:DUF87 domain-containing protein [Candidatus Woesearchaeota archaeon]|nr:DUF87 domain-containing protein [Candidatus Woesearchaeota archaeon]